MHSLYNAVAGRNVERLAALSDGLFAIAMTLLVLELHGPAAEAIRSDADLLAALKHLAPQIAVWGMSFMTLGIFWVGQQTQLNQLDSSDRDLTWIQLGFLASISLLPFTTRLLGEFILHRPALLLYWLNVLLPGVLLLISWLYSRRAGLLKSEVGPEADRAVVRRIVIAQLLYALGAALCVIGTWWSIGFIVLVQLNYAFAPFERLSRQPKVRKE